MRLTKTLSSLTLLLTLLLFSFLGLFLYANGIVLYIDLLIIIASITAMKTLSTSKNFILILAITLTTGFVLLFYQFFKGATLASQVDFIIQHVILTASLILIWLLFSTVKNLQAETTELKKRVSQLEKYEGSLHLLTNAEFVNRAQIISTGAKRRGEENYLILFTVTTTGVTKESLHHVFSQALLSAVRAQFDLVTKLTDGSYLVYLQNTNEKGCHIVVNRLFQSLTKNLNAKELPVTYKVMKEDEINSVEKMLFTKESDVV
jgi:hypothetical protein